MKNLYMAAIAATITVPATVLAIRFFQEAPTAQPFVTSQGPTVERLERLAHLITVKVQVPSQSSNREDSTQSAL